MEIEPSLAGQIIANGLTLSLLYVLMALGFTLIFGILRVFNFAHGEFYMLGAIGVFYVVRQAGLPFPAGLILAAIGVGLLGMMVERFLFRPLHGQTYACFMVALGTSLGFTTATRLIAGPNPKKMLAPIAGVAQFMGASVAWQNIAVVLISAALVIGLYIIIKRTKFGLALRATAANPLAASLVGVGVSKLRTQVFGISTALAGAAGALVAPLYFISPYIGGAVMFKSMVVVIMGGLGSIPGAVLGGFLLGFIESIGLTFVGGIANIFGWLLVIILLIFRPQGLLGEKE